MVIDIVSHVSLEFDFRDGKCNLGHSSGYLSFKQHKYSIVFWADGKSNKKRLQSMQEVKR